MDRLSSHRATKEVVNKHNFKFSKSLGQNFLIDDNVIDRILEGARLSETDRIIEVGPGIGTLTREMGKVAENVVAIEIDKTLIPILKETLADLDNVEVVNEDILKVDVQGLINEKLVALEMLLSMKRAGAKMIITYYALEASKWLKEEE